MPKNKPKKTPKPGKKNRGGRPLFDGKPEAIVLSKLEYVWGIGGSDAEAAFYADISPASLSKYIAAHPDVLKRKEALLARPVLLARQAVLEAFDGHTTITGKGKKQRIWIAPKNPDMAMKYLERKHKDEFSPRNELTGKNGDPLANGPSVVVYLPHNGRDPLPLPPGGSGSGGSHTPANPGQSGGGGASGGPVATPDPTGKEAGA